MRHRDGGRHGGRGVAAGAPHPDDRTRASTTHDGPATGGGDGDSRGCAMTVAAPGSARCSLAVLPALSEHTTAHGRRRRLFGPENVGGGVYRAPHDTDL